MNQTKTQCTRTDLANGVSELRITEPTRQAVEELFAHFSEICDEAAARDNAPVRFLVDTGAKPLPFVTTSSEVRKWSSKYGSAPTRTAVLYEGAFATMADMLSRTIGNNRTPFRVFKPSDREAAIAWLLEK